MLLRRGLLGIGVQRYILVYRLELRALYLYRTVALLQRALYQVDQPLVGYLIHLSASGEQPLIHVVVLLVEALEFRYLA